jgi:hypothetical protein
VSDKNEIDKELEVLYQQIENIEEFVYLGSLMPWNTN